MSRFYQKEEAVAIGDRFRGREQRCEGEVGILV